MSWQLANEPRPGSDANAKPHFDVFVKWVDETAGFIKKLAPRQLVSTGNEGWMGTAGSRELFVKTHASRNVDYLTFHMWAPNWSWYDPKNAAATYDDAWKKMQDYLNWHIDAANELGKPIVLEEFGINRDQGSYSPSATTVYRDKFYTGIYALLARRAAAGDAIAGSNFWAWNGAGRTHNADFYWKAGDAFVGDPPQEPQGLYGVFDSETRRLKYASAGHNPSYLVPAKRDKAVALETMAPEIGVKRGFRFKSGKVDVPPQSRLYVFSDGAYEFATKDGSVGTLDDFVSILLLPPVPGRSESRRIYQEVRRHALGDKLEDAKDQTVKFFKKLF
jgi:endo-1,4-beta-mannosidase